MGKRGPRPMAKTELKRTGSFRADRHGSRGDNAGFPNGKPIPPAYLSAEAREVWDFVCQHVPPDLLSPADSIALASLTKWLGQFDEWMHKAEAKIGDPYKVQRAALAAWGAVAGLMGQFGLTPVARARMLPTGKKEEEATNPLLEIVRMREGAKRKPG